MKKEIAEYKDLSPVDNATKFLSNGGTIEHLEKMMELQERHEANQAKKAFHSAMAEFKKNPPDLLKSKKVTYVTDKGVTEYNHAQLGVITMVIGSALSKHGLNATWKTNQAEKQIEVTCIITHALGFSESTTIASPPDPSGGKNSIQAIGSTITYLQRYTLLALTGLAAHDQDDDGKGANETLPERKEIAPDKKVGWKRAKEAYKRDGDFKNVLKHADISEENQKLIIKEIDDELSRSGHDGGM